MPGAAGPCSSGGDEEEAKVPSKPAGAVGESLVKDASKPLRASAANDADDGLLGISQKGSLFLLLLMGANFLEGADAQMLPATFKVLELDLGMSPASLGAMALGQGVCQNISAIIWGILADRVPRTRLLVCSCWLWGLVALLLAASRSIATMMVLRCVHGAALAAMSPIVQSVVADLVPRHSRGRVYGCLHFAMYLGMIATAMTATTMATWTLSFDIRGWRGIFGCIGILSMLYAVLLMPLEEPPREAEWRIQARDGRSLWYGAVQRVRRLHRAAAARGADASESPHVVLAEAPTPAPWYKTLRRLFRIPSFVALIVEGMFALIPICAVQSFLTLFIQYCGFNDAEAALVQSSLLLGSACGGILGGEIGDRLWQRSQRYGRPLAGQISMLLTAPVGVALIKASPRAPSVTLPVVLSFLMGIVGTWAGAGTCRPILSEVVGPRERASVLAWASAIQGGCGALFGPSLVGLISEHAFAYKKAHSVKHLPAESTRLALAHQHNAGALGSAILWTALPCWLVSACLFGLLHLTYSADVRIERLRAHMLVET